MTHSLVVYLSAALVVAGALALNAQQSATPPASAYTCPLDGSPHSAGPDPLASGAWTSGGWFDDPRPAGVDANRKRILLAHGGLELAGVAGTKVYAVRAGRVAVSAAWRHLGNVVVIDHGDGEYSVYGLLGERTTSEGATVARHDVIGSVGFSGFSGVIRADHPEATPRLHFALIHGARAGLANARGPLRAMNDWTDAWERPLGPDVSGPIDPATRMPAACWLGKSTRPSP